MRALLSRFVRSTGLVGLILLLLLSVASIAYVAGVGPAPPIDRGTLIALIVFVTTVVLGGVKYRRSVTTGNYQQILTALEQSGREYCVVLRTFGRDGEIILPTRRRFRVFVLNLTLEQVVAKAVRRSLDLDTYAIVDQNVRFAPPGPTFMRSSNHDWKSAAGRLISRAHSIVLILTPGQDMGEGFAWEIEQIAQYGVSSRVVIVLPPYDRDVHAHQEALKQAGVLLASLEGPAMEGMGGIPTLGYQPALPGDTLLVRPGTEKADLRTWVAGGRGPLTLGQLGGEIVRRVVRWFRRQPQPQERRMGTELHGHRERKKALTDADYVAGLVEALDEIDIDLAEMAFDGPPEGRAAGGRTDDQARLDADHEQAISDNRARCGPEAPIRAEIRKLNHRIRDRERAARPSLEMTPWGRFGYRCLMGVSAVATSVSSWFMWDAWAAGAGGLGCWVFMTIVARQAAKQSLPSLYSDRHELQGRLGCGATDCRRCHHEEVRPRGAHMFRQFWTSA